MIFSIFSNYHSKGEICTPQLFDHYTTQFKTKLPDGSEVSIQQLCQLIADEHNHDKRGELKKCLPLITWQASYDNGWRRNAEACPSGLYILDIDHLQDPLALWLSIKPRCEDLSLVFAGLTPSTHGLRLVAECRPEFSSLAECQQWLAAQIGTDYDSVCKDFARASFLPEASYIYHFDRSIFDRIPNVVYLNPEYKHASDTLPEVAPVESTPAEQPSPEQPLQHTYRGLELRRIAEEYLRANGGEPEQGERNTRLFKLAGRMRYICDFNEQVVLANMPSYGLPESEMRTLVHSAMSGLRSGEIPSDLREVIDRMSSISMLSDPGEVSFDEEDLYASLDISKIPVMPPIFKQWYDAAPTDFKIPVVLCQLPILGTLGSRLRARYADGTIHSPSFQVSLEAPQASGKSFIRRLVDYELRSIKIHDEAERAKERNYKDMIKKFKLTNPKASKKEMAQLLDDQPHPLVRYVPPTMSITQLLIRTHDANGLHLFAVSEEIDTVHKAFKKGFSNLSEVLRSAFDNAEYGQDYASENSFSGIVHLYYNTLFSGTPKAIRRFYPDVEDGLVSRVTFVTIPDQFGKPMPVWKEFTPYQKEVVDLGLSRLDAVTIVDETVQPPHVMDMDWLALNMERWVKAQQKLAVLQNDRTRDVFARRSAVVGFRAGMLAWFLWDENPSPQTHSKVIRFSRWIASLMLRQHLLRFSIEEDVRNIFPFKKVFDAMPNEFSINDLHNHLLTAGIRTEVRQILYKWRTLGVVVGDKTHGSKNYKKVAQ